MKALHFQSLVGFLDARVMLALLQLDAFRQGGGGVSQ